MEKKRCTEPPEVKTPKVKTREVETRESDLGLVGYLVTLGWQLIAVGPLDRSGRRFGFTLTNTSGRDPDRDAACFYAGGQIPALVYAASLREVKGALARARETASRERQDEDKSHVHP